MTEQDKTITRLEDYKPPAFLIRSVDLTFDLDAEVTEITSTLRGAANPGRMDNDNAFVLNGRQLDLKWIELNGHRLESGDYQLDKETLVINDVPNEFKVEIKTVVRPSENTSNFGLYQTEGNLCTHCEPDGFSKMTYFPDRPDILAVYTVTIDADLDAYPVLLSNGNRVEKGSLGDGRHWVRWEDPIPKPSYLFALVAGKFERLTDFFTTRSGRQITLNIFADATIINKTQWAMESLKVAMKWDEEAYNREYFLDLYNIAVVSDHNFGAMESQGLNIFNPVNVVAQGSAPATDDDYKQIRINIAHEYFHHWSGNRVTCRDWFQLCLKEGFTTFRHSQFEEDLYGTSVSRIGRMRIIREKQFSEDEGTSAHPVQPKSYREVSNFYTLTVYDKGCELVRMLHLLIGEDNFKKGSDLFFERHDGQAVTIEAFLPVMEEVSGKDLKQFRLWYHQPGTPHLKVTTEYDAADKTYSVTIKQYYPQSANTGLKKPLHIPFRMGLLDKSGRELALQLENEPPGEYPTSKTLEIRNDITTFRFKNIDEKPVPSFLRGFSAPVRLEYNYSDEELIFLMAHDSDLVSRWDAAQCYISRFIMKRMAQHARGRNMGLDQQYIEVMRNLINSREQDPYFVAEMLTFPSEKDLSEQMDIIDVEGICRARDFVIQQLASHLKKDLLTCYEENDETGEYAPDRISRARRHLKNVCLGYLMALKDPKIVDLCFDQAVNGKNMTDMMAALTILNNFDVPEREKALTAYYRRWESDPLAIDKWFQVQASTRLPNALEQVKALAEHPAFDITRVDRVRSLMAWFFMLNFRNFHHKSGNAYQYFTDVILLFDSFNPVGSAWFFRKSDFVRWRKFDSERQHLIQKQLDRFLESSTLSKGLHELVTRTLT
ncbi:MAG: aminopeptidase N [Deltaproteobacteria bacterium]|nr:aminopeptidase N [Deltaproteobacteria bacterium]